VSSFDELHLAKAFKAKFSHSNKGFHDRNTTVAKGCDYLIAFTFGKGDQPADGGTLDTWKKCPLASAKRVHFPLGDF